MPEQPPYPSTPRWVVVSGVVLIVLVLLVGIMLFTGMLFTGLGGPHGPRRHLPSAPPMKHAVQRTDAYA